MRQDRGAGAAYILCHSNGCAIHLGGTAFAAQLLNNLDDLIHARRADWMSTRFQSASRTDGNPATDPNLILQPKPHSLTTLREARRFQRKRRHDGKGVVQFKHVNIIGRHSRHFIRLLR